MIHYSKSVPAKNVLIAYHANCIDGFTSAYITARGVAFETGNIDLLPMHYTDESTSELHTKLESTDYDELYIVDFSVSVGTLAALGALHQTLEVTLLDHHKTAFEKYMESGYKVTPTSYFEDRICDTYVVLDNAHSGAGICWNYMNSSKAQVPLLVLYVEDYDLWRFEFGDETRWINKYLSTQEQTLDRWTELEAALEEESTRAEILKAGAELQVAHDKAVAKTAANAQSIQIGGVRGLFAECTYKLTSDVGHALAVQSGTFGLMFQWPDTPEGRVKFSLRSDNAGDFDVSEIAKRFGGGGHKNAAGFETCVEEASHLLSHGA